MFANYIDDIIKKYLDSFETELKNNKFVNISDNKIIINNINDFVKNKSNVILKSYSIDIIIFTEFFKNFLYLYLFIYKYVTKYNNISINDFILKNLQNINIFKNSNFNLLYIKYVNIFYDIVEKQKNEKFLFKNDETNIVWNIIKKENKKISDLNIINQIIIILYYKNIRRSIYNIFFNSKKYIAKKINIVINTNIINKKLDFKSFNRIFNNENIELSYYAYINKFIATEKLKSKNFFIHELVRNDLLFFITNDYLRYNRLEYKYDEILMNDKSRKSKRKINILINIINLFNKYYDSDISKEDRNNQLKLILNKKNMSIAANDLEEIKILNRIYDETNNNVIKNDFYNELLSIREYPYLNFNNFTYPKINIKFKKSVKLIRFSTISNLVDNKVKNDIKKNIQIRNSGKDIKTDIVGFCLPSIKSNNVNIHYNININEVKDKINKFFFNKLNESHYFIFYKNIDENNILNFFKLIYKIYIDQIKILINHQIMNKTLKQSINFINNINYSSYLNEKIKQMIIPDILKKYKKNVKYIIDKNEKNWINYKFENVKNKYIKNKNEKKMYCQHVYDLKKLKNTNNINYTTDKFTFINKYANYIYDGDVLKYVMCKSCNEKLNIDSFIDDSNFNLFNTNYVPLNELDEFEKYNDLIKFLKHQINNFILNFNLKFNSEILIDNIIKQIIYSVKYNYYYLIHYINNNDNEIINLLKKLNIENSVLYPIDIDYISQKIFNKNSRNEKNNLIINNLYCYIIAIFIVNITEIDLYYIKTNKFFNILSYNKWKNNIFSKLNISIENNIINPIIKYDILCYLIFIFSSYIFKNKLWQVNDDTKYGVNIHLEIISTTINLINNIYIFTKKNFNNLLKDNISIAKKIFISINDNMQYVKEQLYKNTYKYFGNILLFKKIFKKYFNTNESKNILDKNIAEKLNIYNIKNGNKVEENILTIKNNNLIIYYYNKKIKNYKLNISNINYELINKTIKNIKCANESCNFDLNYLLKSELNELQKSINKKNQSIISNNSIKYDYIKNIYSKKNENYMYNFLNILKKYSQNDIDLFTKKYYIIFFHNLKYRQNILYINKNELKYENNLKIESSKSVYSYYSKTEKIYYYFDEKTLQYIGYSLNNKNFMKVNNTLLFSLIKVDNIIDQYSYLGFNSDNIKNIKIIKNDNLLVLLNNQVKEIKIFIINFIKSLQNIFNDKTISSNINHPFINLKKYIIEYNIEKFDINKHFKYYNYLFIDNFEKIDSLETYIKKYNYINFYLIYNLTNIIEESKSKLNISLFIYEYISNYIEKTSLLNNFKNNIFETYLENNKFKIYNLINNKISDNIITDKDSIIYKENVDEEVQEMEEDVLNDNDNDEDDTIKSKLD